MARRNGNVPWAISEGVVLIIAFGMIEFLYNATFMGSHAFVNALGVFLIGLTVGLLAKGAMRGLFSGAVAGVAGAVVIYLIFSFLAPGIRLQLVSMAYSSSITLNNLISLCLNDAAFAGIGGLITGFLRKNR